MAVEKWIVEACEQGTELRMQTPTGVEPVRVKFVDGRSAKSPVLVELPDGLLYFMDETGKSVNKSFTLLPPKPPPMECWVNEYKEFMTGHRTRDVAIANAVGTALRVAVHMREVRDD